MKGIGIFILIATATTAIFGGDPPAPTRYIIIDLGGLGGCCTSAYSINNNGQIAGTALNGASANRAFIWQNGVVASLGTLSGANSFGFSINDNGQVAGGSDFADTPYNSENAFLWESGVMRSLDPQPGTYGFPSEGHGLNNSGVVVGQGQRGDGIPAPIVFSNGTVTKLPTPAVDGNGNPYSVGSALAINDSGQIVGFGDRVARVGGGPVPLLWQGSSYIRLGTLNENDERGEALAINSAGQVVGWSIAANGRPHAFFWQNGTMSDLGGLRGGTDSIAYGINSSGVIVGNALDLCPVGACGPNTAFVYENGVMYDLQDLIPADSGVKLQTATAINDSGQIVVNNGVRAYLLTPVVSVDTTSPAINCNRSDDLWHGSDVSIVCTASDSGSGLTDSSDGSFLLSTSVAIGAEDANAQTNSRQVCDKAGNCAIAGPIGGNMIDKRPPAITCNTSDGLWHGSDVSITCTAWDSGSGLTNASDSSFLLSTSVPAGVEDANAQASSRQVCDKVGNCAAAGPIGGNMVDKRPPSIEVLTPIANAVYLLKQAVPTNYGCTDGGSGVATCLGSANLDTLSVGLKTFAVNATDAVGNTSAQSISYAVSFSVFVMSDPSKPENNVKVEVELHDANGVNVSSPTISLTAQSIDGTRSLSDTFSYTKAKGGAYKFNVPRDISAGSHILYFQADGDPTLHAVPFTSR